MNGITAAQNNLVRCHCCSVTVRASAVHEDEELRCPRCDSTIELRIANSVNKTLALLLTAIILMIPANLLPVMIVVSAGSTTSDTIMSGVVHLAHAGMYPIALLVFVASIVVPLFKILGLLFIIITLKMRLNLNRKQATLMYRLVHFIGKWSMLDLFMISILVTLVNLGAVATIETGAGSTAFASVVVLTMLAAHTFDPRLIWDSSTSA